MAGLAAVQCGQAMAGSLLLNGSNNAAVHHQLQSARPSLQGPVRRGSKSRRATAVAMASNNSRREMMAGSMAGMILLPQLAGAEDLPVQIPDLSKCQDATVTNRTTGVSTKLECCPPSVPKYKEFKPDTKNPPRVRPASHKLDAAYIAKYELAYAKMRALPDSDPRSLTQQGKVHCAYCNDAYPQTNGNTLQVHFNWLFFPFHRAYLYYHEKILGKLIDDPTFALPFWNWDNQRISSNANVIQPYYLNPASALYDVNRNPAHGKGVLVDLGYSSAPTTENDQIRLNNLGVMYASVVNQTTASVYMGQPYYAGGAINGTSSAGSMEASPHTAVHAWGGNPANPNNEDLGNFSSAGYDPLFYAHHGNVDRLWSVWETLPDAGRVKRKTYDDPLFLEAAFLFYDENKDLVKIKVKDVLKTTNLGYVYTPVPEDIGWIKYDPVSKSSPVVPSAALEGFTAGNVKDALKQAVKSIGKSTVSDVKDAAKDVKSAVKNLFSVAPLGVGSAMAAEGGSLADNFEEFGSSKKRGGKDRDLGKKPVSVRAVRPSAIPEKLKDVPFDDLEEILVLEGVLVPKDGTLVFDVFLNLPEADEATTKTTAEYVGTFYSIPQGGAVVQGKEGRFRRTNVRFAITNNLRRLGITDVSDLVVTIVPKGDDADRAVKLKGITIEYE